MGVPVALGFAILIAQFSGKSKNYASSTPVFPDYSQGLLTKVRWTYSIILLVPQKRAVIQEPGRQ